MNSLQIALCDDNSLSRQLAQLAIQEYERQHPDRPCRVHAFSSGTALLSFLDVHKDFSFDLFILDVMMPTLDGIQIGKELRARGNRGHIVYLSASPDFAIPAYEVHAYSYLLSRLTAPSCSPSSTRRSSARASQRTRSTPSTSARPSAWYRSTSW